MFFKKQYKNNHLYIIMLNQSVLHTENVYNNIVELFICTKY